MSNTYSFKRGQIIFEQGAKENYMYDIISGKVGIYSDWGGSNETELAVVENEFIGDMGLVNSRKRIATAVALTDCELERIEQDGLEAYLEKNNDKAIALVHQLYKRLSQTEDELIDSCRVIKDFLSSEEADEKKPGLLEKMKRLAGIVK